MNHLTAAQRGEGGGWHYVSVNRRTGGHPIGYCAEHDPHATEAEARECYGQYQRDRVVLDGTCSWTTCDSKGCPNPANQSARVQGDGFQMAALCPEHFTREEAIQAMHLDGPAGDAWKS